MCTQHNRLWNYPGHHNHMFRKEQDSIVLVLTVVESDITNENKTSLCSVFLIFFPSNEEDCSFLYLVLPIQSWMALRYLTVSSQHWWKASRARAQQTVWTTTKRQPPFLSAPSSSSYSSPHATKRHCAAPALGWSRSLSSTRMKTSSVSSGISSKSLWNFYTSDIEKCS